MCNLAGPSVLLGALLLANTLLVLVLAANTAPALPLLERRRLSGFRAAA